MTDKYQGDDLLVSRGGKFERLISEPVGGDDMKRPSRGKGERINDCK